ncbi:MAG TPA: hypothetical protein VF950_20125 [Planctomycetota bacterium]
MRAFLLVLLPLLQDRPLPIKFLMQHDTGAKDGRGARKLTPDEEQALAKEFRAMPGMKDVAVKDGVFTLTPGTSIKLSELRAAGKKAPVQEGFHQIVLNTLKLEGQVTVALEVAKNRDKLKDILKAEEGPGGWTFKASGQDVPTLVKTVCAKCGVDYKLFEVLKDITWPR